MIYSNIYNLIVTYLFGGSVAVGSYVELVAILLSSCATIFCFALPFVIVWRAIKFLMGR